MADALSAILETREAERLATGFVFTEGPLWHPDGFYYFVDVRSSVLYRLTPGRAHEVVRDKTGGGNGTTFDLQGAALPLRGGESAGHAHLRRRPHRSPHGPVRGQTAEPSQ
jgi:gluconolactonase